MTMEGEKKYYKWKILAELTLVAARGLLMLFEVFHGGSRLG
ncbi:hypothetical protein ACFYOK_36995 [Microbispora bryophytorum]